MELAPGLGDRLVDLVQSPGFVPYAFVLAFVAGAAHAVGPGHGKSLAAAYLVGSGGRLRDAAWLGASVAVMHTVSVLVIGVAWTFFSLSDLVSMPRLTAGLQLVGGLMVVAVGVWLLRRHLRGAAHSHSHSHSHDHSHGHSHGHSYGPSRPGLVLLGICARDGSRCVRAWWRVRPDGSPSRCAARVRPPGRWSAGPRWTPAPHGARSA